MINFNPGTVYVYNQDGTSTERLDINECSIECKDEDSCECKDEFNYISNNINNTIEASFEVACRMLEEALFYISGARDVVIKCCPNRKVVYLATHSKKRRIRKKNIHRAIKILEELAEVNND